MSIGVEQKLAAPIKLVAERAAVDEGFVAERIVAHSALENPADAGVDLCAGRIPEQLFYAEDAPALRARRAGAGGQVPAGNPRRGVARRALRGVVHRGEEAREPAHARGGEERHLAGVFFSRCSTLVYLSIIVPNLKMKSFFSQSVKVYYGKVAKSTHCSRRFAGGGFRKFKGFIFNRRRSKTRCALRGFRRARPSLGGGRGPRRCPSLRRVRGGGGLPPPERETRAYRVSYNPVNDAPYFSKVGGFF